MKNIYIIILTVLTFNVYGQVIDKELQLINGKKTINISQGYIGLKTKTDSIAYFGEKDLSFKIHKITDDSLYLTKPLAYHYDLVTLDKNGNRSKYLKSSRFLKSFRKNKVKYETYIVVDTLLQKAFSLSEIVSIDYPPKGSDNTGCIMCIFLPLIPGVNVWFYYEMRKRWHPKTYEIGKWRLKANANTAANR